MKRIYVDKGIFLKVNDSGKVCKNCFEVSVKTTFKKLSFATDLFKKLYDNWNTVYLCETKNGFLVEFKTYTENMNEAVMIRNQVNSVVEVWKNERK